MRLGALDGLSRHDGRWLAAGHGDAVVALALPDGLRASGSTRDAELDAMTAATLAENAAHGGASRVFASDNGLGGDAPRGAGQASGVARVARSRPR